MNRITTALPNDAYADWLEWLKAQPEPREHGAACADGCLDLHVLADDLERKGHFAPTGTVSSGSLLAAGYEADRRAEQWAECARRGKRTS